MNRKLYASFLLSTALLTAPVYAEYVFSHSGDFKTTLGADMNLQAGGRFQSQSKTKQLKDGVVVRIGPSANNEDVAFTSTAHVYLGAENKTKAGTKYGAQVGIFATTRGGLPTKDFLGRTYGYLENNNWGRFEVGTKKGVSTSMQLDGDEIAAGTGGFNGDWDHYITLTSYQGPGYTTKAMNMDNFTTFTGLVIKDNSSSANNEGARKITYYTPKYQGHQFVISYIPDEANKGGNDSDNRPFVSSGPTRKLKNAFMGAAAYEKEINKKQSFKIVLVGETGKVTKSARDRSAGRTYTKNPIGYSIGAVYYYDKFGIAGSYGSSGKFPYRKQANLKRDMFCTAGVSYQVTEKVKTSLTYFYSYNRNTLNVFSVGANYSWMPGVQPYAEVTHVIAKQKYNYDPVSSTATSNGTPGVLKAKNKGTVALMGVRISI